MSDTLQMLKNLYNKKKYLNEEIYYLEAEMRDLIREKHEIEEQIDKLIMTIPLNNQRKSLRASSCRLVSNFVKPSKISDELACFLGKEKGTMMARTNVTRELNRYIRLNNLQDNKNKRIINPDEKLIALFKLKDGDELTYFNIQKYMSHHFTN